MSTGHSMVILCAGEYRHDGSFHLWINVLDAETAILLTRAIPSALVVSHSQYEVRHRIVTLDYCAVCKYSFLLTQMFCLLYSTKGDDLPCSEPQCLCESLLPFSSLLLT